jgi:C-terminal processing protease CtpA/Prc
MLLVTCYWEHNSKIEFLNSEDMKTSNTLIFCLEICLFLMLFTFQESFSQVRINGDWEGTFMNDFKAIVHFTASDRNQSEGDIKMFSGENKIQDDQINKVKLSGYECSFFIPAKETTFKGNFNEQMTELSGEFIFPDGSRHPIQLTKMKLDQASVKEIKQIKDQYFTKEALHADLEFLYQNLKNHHPQLYAYTSKGSMDMMVKELKAKIDTSYTVEQFYLLATQLTDAVHCSHTGVKLPRARQNSVNRRGNYFPLRLFFSNGKAFYVAGLSEGAASIRPGQEIISINDMPIDQIITKLFYCIPAEAFNTTTKYHVLNKRFQELYYLLSDQKEFLVKFKSGGTVKSLTVPVSSLKDLYADYPKSETKMVYKTDDSMDAGILKVPTFGIKNMDHYFYRLDSVFKDLEKRNTQNLVLDLRDNKGGHPIFAAQLFSYLTNKDFIYFKRNDEVEEFEPLYRTMKPNMLNFNGNLYVLVNGGCLSTTGHLISLLKFNTDAIFIGEEPGSTFRCNDFSIQSTLPLTSIELNVPRTTFETAVSGFSMNELFPIDYRVNRTIDDIVYGKDVIYEKAREKILQK